MHSRSSVLQKRACMTECAETALPIDQQHLMICCNHCICNNDRLDPIVGAAACGFIVAVVDCLPKSQIARKQPKLIAAILVSAVDKVLQRKNKKARGSLTTRSELHEAAQESLHRDVIVQRTQSACNSMNDHTRTTQ